MMKFSCIVKSLFLTAMVVAQTNYLNGQTISDNIEQNDIRFSIKYVGQFPTELKKNKEGGKSDNLDRKKSKNKNWFTDLIFGKKPTGILRPISVLASSPDSIWIFDQGNGAITNVFNNVGEITQFKKNKSVIFPSLIGSCYMPNRNILFTDSKLNKIFKFNTTNNTLEIINDTLTLNMPTGVAYLAMNKEIWVVETNAHRVTVLNDKGEIIRYIGRRGNAPGEFNYPTFIWIDNLGIVYVIDTLNSRVQMFNRDGQLIGNFGEAGDALGSFARPKGIATDSFGHIYVADGLFNNVQIFDKTGKLLSVFGSKGSGSEEFLMPVGIFIDSYDFIYLADSYNSRIQIFKLETE